MAIVGDFDAQAITPLVDQLFGHWKASMHVAPVLRKNGDIAPLHEFLNTSDKENGFYTARINLDLNVDDPDYPALMLADYIFGGRRAQLAPDGPHPPEGRLVLRRRLEPLVAGDLDRAGMFAISAIAAPQNLARVDAAVREELARALKEGFTAAELAGAKSGLMQQRIQNRADDGALAAGWTSLHVPRQNLRMVSRVREAH